MGVNSLNELPKASKSGQFLMMDHVSFDQYCETIVHLLKECSFAPLDTCCKLDKLDKIFSSLMILLDMESFKLGFSFFYGIIGTEVQFEFMDEKCKVR